jgi:hypothetical protein
MAEELVRIPRSTNELKNIQQDNLHHLFTQRLNDEMVTIKKCFKPKTDLIYRSRQLMEIIVDRSAVNGINLKIYNEVVFEQESETHYISQLAVNVVHEAVVFLREYVEDMSGKEKAAIMEHALFLPLGLVKIETEEHGFHPVVDVKELKTLAIVCCIQIKPNASDIERIDNIVRWKVYLEVRRGYSRHTECLKWGDGEPTFQCLTGKCKHRHALAYVQLRLTPTKWMSLGRFKTQTDMVVETPYFTKIIYGCQKPRGEQMWTYKADDTKVVTQVEIPKIREKTAWEKEAAEIKLKQRYEDMIRSRGLQDPIGTKRKIPDVSTLSIVEKQVEPDECKPLVCALMNEHKLVLRQEPVDEREYVILTGTIYNEQMRVMDTSSTLLEKKEPAIAKRLRGMMERIKLNRYANKITSKNLIHQVARKDEMMWNMSQLSQRAKTVTESLFVEQRQPSPSQNLADMKELRFLFRQMDIVARDYNRK